jgi:DNA-binding transcriptional regulator YhcF (GntR family)
MIVENFKDFLKEELKSGFLEGNEKLPSLRKLAEQYSVSISSVKRAIDELQDEGLLTAVHGKGVFVGGSKSLRSRKTMKMLGLLIVNDLSPAKAKQLKEDWLDKGWIIATYDASSDKQSAAMEKSFLVRAEEHGFAGVALVPTPREPRNNEFFQKLRMMGMKIALLAPNQDDMSKENFFLLDHEHAGYLGVSQAAAKGYRNILFMRLETNIPYIGWQERGLRNACQELGMNLIESRRPDQWGGYEDGWTEENRCQHLVRINQSMVDYFRQLPENTAILTNQSDLAEVVKHLIIKSGRKLADDLGVCCLFGDRCEKYGNSSMKFPYSGRIDKAIEYLVDDKISSTEKVQVWFKPEFVERGTMRSL